MENLISLNEEQLNEYLKKDKVIELIENNTIMNYLDNNGNLFIECLFKSEIMDIEILNKLIEIDFLKIKNENQINYPLSILFNNKNFNYDWLNSIVKYNVNFFETDKSNETDALIVHLFKSEKCNKDILREIIKNKLFDINKTLENGFQCGVYLYSNKNLDDKMFLYFLGKMESNINIYTEVGTNQFKSILNELSNNTSITELMLDYIKDSFILLKENEQYTILNNLINNKGLHNFNLLSIFNKEELVIKNENEKYIYENILDKRGLDRYLVDNTLSLKKFNIKEDDILNLMLFNRTLSNGTIRYISNKVEISSLMSVLNNALINVTKNDFDIHQNKNRIYKNNIINSFINFPFLFNVTKSQIKDILSKNENEKDNDIIVESYVISQIFNKNDIKKAIHGININSEGVLNTINYLDNVIKNGENKNYKIINKIENYDNNIIEIAKQDLLKNKKNNIQKP